MIKKTTLCFFIFLSLSLNAQNWQCIKTDAISHFKSSNDYIASVRIDSTFIGDTFTDYISYHMVRDGLNGLISNGDSWIGPKFRLMNSGDNIFYNSLSEEILIPKPQQVSQTWQMFRSNTNNLIIHATISLFQEETFLGVTDSIATINLNVTDTNGLTVANPCSNFVLKLSKNFGLINTLDFYNFPFITETYDGYGTYPTNTLDLVGLDNPQIGWQNLTAKDIYDWEVGDEFHTYENHSPALPPGASDFSSQRQLIRKILSKNLTSDSVSYLVERCSYSEITFFNPYNKEKLKTTDTVIEKYAFNNPINMLAYEFDLSLNGIFNFYLKTDTEIQDNSSFYFVNSQNNECHEVIFTNVFYYTWIKQLGSTYYDQNSGTGETVYNNLIYYKKGSLEWGTPYNCETLGIPTIQNSLFKIYPNPTQDKIYLELENNQIEILNCSIRDLSGKEVLPLKNNISEIDLSTFENGIYMLNFETENGHYFYKISKQ